MLDKKQFKYFRFKMFSRQKAFRYGFVWSFNRIKNDYKYVFIEI